MTTDEHEKNVDDLHALMAIAVLCGRRTVPVDLIAIYEAWEKYFPEDALGPMGRGLSLIGRGETRDGYALIEVAALGAKTRADQARGVLETLRRDLGALVPE